MEGLDLGSMIFLIRLERSKRFTGFHRLKLLSGEGVRYTPVRGAIGLFQWIPFS